MAATSGPTMQCSLRHKAGCTESTERRDQESQLKAPSGCSELGGWSKRQRVTSRDTNSSKCVYRSPLTKHCKH